MIENFRGIDGLVLCVIKGKIDLERWISEIDMLDHSVLNYDDILQSVNNLLKGNLIVKQMNKFVLTAQSEQILKGGWRMSALDWQLSVRQKIVSYKFDNAVQTDFFFSREEYDTAYKEYFNKMSKKFR